MAFKSAKVYNQMSDEMESLDDELRTLCSEIRKDISAMEQTNAPLSSDQLNRAFQAVKGKLDRARSSFQKCKLELRELSKEQHNEYEPKLKEHARVIDELSRQLNAERERISALKSKDSERLELFGPRTDKEKGIANGENKDAQQLIKDAKSVQSQSIAAVNRMQSLVNESEEIGINTNAKLKIQTEQMGTIKSDVDKVQANMVRADKLLNSIGRSLMTDKLLLCLLLLVIIGILTIVILKIIGVDLKGNNNGALVIDCSLSWTKSFKECQSAQDQDVTP